MGLLFRIAARYLIGALAGLMLWAGIPPEVIEMITQDPEIVMGVTLAMAGLVEWVTVQARRRGWLT